MIRWLVRKFLSKIVYIVLQLFYVMIKDKVPVRIKAMLAGAFIYFLAPVDLIPDVIPIIGYTDDITVWIAAFLTVAKYIDRGVQEQAQAKIKKWFGKVW
ncbi:MAG TPA: DUF1232 domain-containing protein [Negativicutes bacterium]